MRCLHIYFKKKQHEIYFEVCNLVNDGNTFIQICPTDAEIEITE